VSRAPARCAPATSLARRLAPPLLALALCATARAAGPGAAPVSRTGGYSPYEQETLAAALRDRGTEIDPAPEGKTIEQIEIAPLEVFEPRDPAPGVLNRLHATTRPYVVRREVLVAEGQPYRKVLVDETARNLRQISQLSLVLAVPVRGSAPDKVRLLVITKDVWSLRLNWDISFSSGGLESLTLQPTEANLLGSQQTASVQTQILPESYSLGARYGVPRLWGSRVAMLADANIIVNRRSGQPEGSYGTLSVGKPLFSTLTEWSWQSSAAWRTDVVRRYSQARLSTYDAKATPDSNDAIPFQYRGARLAASASLTRSFGWAIKNNVTPGFEMSRRVYTTFDLSAFDPAAADEFVRRNVPTSDTRLGPFLQWRGYSNDFMRVLDFESLGLQEDFRLGHDLYVKVYPVTTALGSSRSFLGVFAGAQYTVPLGDGLARAVVESTTETTLKSGPQGLPDASIEAALRLVTPRFAAGRVVFDARVLDRYRNFLNQNVFLGGDSRLRGYPTNYAVGPSVVNYNLEYRTRPVEILSCQLGGAVFYDVGDAFDGFANMRLKHAAGAGFRVLFPQFDRVVFRGDLGFPVEPHGRPPGVKPYAFFVSFAQAFGVPGVAPLPSGSSSPTAPHRRRQHVPHHASKPRLPCPRRGPTGAPRWIEKKPPAPSSCSARWSTRRATTRRWRTGASSGCSTRSRTARASSPRTC
jgi:hypothetical protein